VCGVASTIALTFERREKANTLPTPETDAHKLDTENKMAREYAEIATRAQNTDAHAQLNMASTLRY
jgi:hypothetical protein